MSKKLTILLLGIHLMGNTEMGQLLKFPQLVHHYFQHRHLNPDLNFIGFIVMHYAGDDGTKDDDDYDRQLPCHNVNQSTVSIAYSPMVNETQLFEESFFSQNEYCENMLSEISPKHVLLILQPPRSI
ncbi:MAG: hypothetical protein HZB42_02150 [Sphingobacteriales bacterium]|nr:hypothetical protein [Sphingobacteriales bacterium]